MRSVFAVAASLVLGLGLALSASLPAGSAQAQDAPPPTPELSECVAVFGVTTAMATNAKQEEMRVLSDKLFRGAATKLKEKGGMDALNKTQDNAARIMKGLGEKDGAATLAREFIACASAYPT
jgi:hypothetical protein